MCAVVKQSNFSNAVRWTYDNNSYVMYDLYMAKLIYSIKLQKTKQSEFKMINDDLVL